MIVIRRMVDRHRAYTAIFLKGEPPKIFPTSDAEHARILQVYKQDRPHEGILNDFSEIDLSGVSAPASGHAPPTPWPLAPQPKKPASKPNSTVMRPSAKAPLPKKTPRSAKGAGPCAWLVPFASPRSRPGGVS